jgi:hypothetical protein
MRVPARNSFLFRAHQICVGKLAIKGFNGVINPVSDDVLNRPALFIFDHRAQFTSTALKFSETNQPRHL